MIGTDVETGGARASGLTRDGILLSRAEHPTDLHQRLPDHSERDSEQIWQAVCACVQPQLWD